MPRWSKPPTRMALSKPPLDNTATTESLLTVSENGPVFWSLHMTATAEVPDLTMLADDSIATAARRGPCGGAAGRDRASEPLRDANRYDCLFGSVAPTVSAMCTRADSVERSPGAASEGTASASR